MTLAAVVDDVVLRAATALGPVVVSDGEPLAAGQLPHVTVSVSDADRPHIGIGGLPQQPETGALPVTVAIDLADPRLTVGADTIDLVDGPRTTVVVPNGPLVKADGTTTTPFTGADFTVTDPGGAYAVVAAEPNGREVRVDHLEGSLRIGQALAAAGTLTLTFFVGIWDVALIRFVGSLNLDVTTPADADTAAETARQVAAVVESLGPPFTRLVPTSWGPAQPGTVVDIAVLHRRLTFDFAFEQRRPDLGTGGGVIRIVEVTGHRDAPTPDARATEEFVVPVPTTP